MKMSLWRRPRRQWREFLKDVARRCVEWWFHIPRPAAEDWLDGRDLGDHDVCGFSGLPPIEPPAAPPLSPVRKARVRSPLGPLTLEDLEELDRQFLAGGEVADAVARGVLRDLRSPPQN
jgi:hypothetical protein